MNSARDQISSAQAEIVRQVFTDGNPQVGKTLQMMLGEAPEHLEIHTHMVPVSDVARRFRNEPLVTVHIDFSGDLKGTFMFLQNESDFARLRNALRNALSGPARTANEETDYLIPDWLQDRRAQTSDDRKVHDALGELGNVLLGGYLTAVYGRSEQATYQDLPETRVPDKEQDWLRGALRDYGASADHALLGEVSCTVQGEPIRFLMLFITERESLSAMLAKLGAA